MSDAANPFCGGHNVVWMTFNSTYQREEVPPWLKSRQWTGTLPLTPVLLRACPSNQVRAIVNTHVFVIDWIQNCFCFFFSSCTIHFDTVTELNRTKFLRLHELGFCRVFFSVDFLICCNWGNRAYLHRLIVPGFAHKIIQRVTGKCTFGSWFILLTFCIKYCRNNDLNNTNYFFLLIIIHKH